MRSIFHRASAAIFYQSLASIRLPREALTDHHLSLPYVVAHVNHLLLDATALVLRVLSPGVYGTSPSLWLLAGVMQ
jgi:hypothetical protein